MAEPLVLGLSLSLVFGLALASCVVVYYKYYQPVGYVGDSTEEIQRRTLGPAGPTSKTAAGWVDVTEFNGVKEESIIPVRPVSRPRSEHSSNEGSTPRRNSVHSSITSALNSVTNTVSSKLSNLPTLRGPRAELAEEVDPDEVEEILARQSQQQQQQVDVVLPTDMRMPTQMFRMALCAYYTEWADDMDGDEIDIAVEAYGSDADGRAALDRQLREQFGQGLDEHFIAVASEPGHQRQVRRQGEEQEKDEASEQNEELTELHRVLNEYDCGESYDLLVQNGVVEVETLRSLEDVAVTMMIADDDEREKMLSMLQDIREPSPST